MKLNKIMSSDVITIAPEATLRDAALMMKTESIGMLPVVDKQKLVGVITDRDIVIRGLTTGSHDQHVKDIMTHDPIVAHENDETKVAIKTMAEHKIGRLVLVDEKNRPIGIISATDIAAADEDAVKIRDLVGTLGKAHKDKAKNRPLTKA